MKKILFLLIAMLLSASTLLAQVGINIDNSDPDGSAMLDVKSTSKGLLPPRVADTNAITTPAEGLQVYDLSSHCMRYYNGTQWSACMGIFYPPWTCGVSFTINHVAGTIAPINKTVTYGTVTNIPGETTKCWITRNLGASQQATAVSDATEASAGWYWQFNRKQGYKHDGTTRTPNTTWITPIIEDLNWQTANDPCTLELGSGWRIPTSTEWANVNASGGWTNWNGPWNSGLKMHAAGSLTGFDGSLLNRGLVGHYWSSMQNTVPYGWSLWFHSGNCIVHSFNKELSFSLRCLRE